MKLQKLLVLAGASVLLTGCGNKVSFKSAKNVVTGEDFKNQIDFLYQTNSLFLQTENPVAYSYVIEAVANTKSEATIKSPQNETLYKETVVGSGDGKMTYDSASCILNSSSSATTTTTKPDLKIQQNNELKQQYQAGSGTAYYDINLLRKEYTVKASEKPLNSIQDLAIRQAKSVGSSILYAVGEDSTCYIDGNVYTVVNQSTETTSSINSVTTNTYQLIVEENTLTYCYKFTENKTSIINSETRYESNEETGSMKLIRKNTSLSRVDTSRMAEKKDYIPVYDLDDYDFE